MRRTSYDVPVGVHNVKLADAKELMRGGMEGWLHVPVRGGEAVDDELIGDRQGSDRAQRPAENLDDTVADHGLDEQRLAYHAARPASGLARPIR